MAERTTDLRRRALAATATSIALLVVGGTLAAARFPGGFDWAYTVMSALASRKHNPDGAAFFSVGLALSLVALWPAVRWVEDCAIPATRTSRFGVRALRVGIVFGVLVGLDRLVFHHLSDLVRKGHEILAIVSFVGLYAGVVALQVDRLRRGRSTAVPAACALVPLVAIGLSQLGLYFDQRDLGWVGRDWREMGVSVWWSFAFWQWLAAAALWASIAHLVASSARPATG